MSTLPKVYKTSVYNLVIPVDFLGHLDLETQILFMLYTTAHNRGLSRFEFMELSNLTGATELQVKAACRKLVKKGLALRTGEAVSLKALIPTEISEIQLKAFTKHGVSHAWITKDQRMQSAAKSSAGQWLKHLHSLDFDLQPEVFEWLDSLNAFENLHFWAERLPKALAEGKFPEGTDLGAATTWLCQATYLWSQSHNIVNLFGYLTEVMKDPNGFTKLLKPAMAVYSEGEEQARLVSIRELLAGHRERAFAVVPEWRPKKVEETREEIEEVLP